MKCDKCGSERLLSFSGKCSDLFSAHFGNVSYQDYVPYDIKPLGGGDYLKGCVCLECGKLQGRFPHADPAFVQEQEDNDTEI